MTIRMAAEPGMVVQAEPVYRAYTDLAARIGHRPRLVYLTPQGKTFTQQMLEGTGTGKRIWCSSAVTRGD